MNAAQFLELLDYFRNWFLGLAPDDATRVEKVVDYLQERGLVEKAPPPQAPAAPANNLRCEMGDGDALLNVREAAELLNCSTKWVYLHYEQLPHIPFGAGPKPRLRFRRKALLAWIDQHEIDWRRKRTKRQ